MIITIYSNDESLDWGAAGTERIVQNVKNILRTKAFEVPFMRDFGVNPDFIDSTTRSIKSEFINHVINVIEANEPKAKVLDVQLTSFDDNGEYIISVSLEV